MQRRAGRPGGYRREIGVVSSVGEARRLPTARNQVVGLSDRRTSGASMGVPRRVSVKGMGNVDATVVVTVARGAVRMSISPPFTWEAMEHVKVNELIHVLELAGDDAQKDDGESR